MSALRNQLPHLKYQTYLLIIFSVATFLTQSPNFQGEDIVNARENYLTGARTDFWGGVSTLIYSNIPSYLFRWQIWLAMTQILMTFFGLRNFAKILSKRKSRKIFNLSVSYFALMFSAQMTRDGFMFSVLILGFSLLSRELKMVMSKKVLVISILTIVFGVSLRPWLSLALAPLVYLILQKSEFPRGKTSLCLVLLALVILPPTLESLTVKYLRLSSSYPEQQVMLMDAAASYCYSNNSSTGLQAQEMLRLFSQNPSSTKATCQFYRTDTWLSLTHSIYPSTVGMQSDLWLIAAGDKTKYQILRKAWVDLIFSDLVTYIQNKSLFFGKLLIGSDSRTFGIRTADSNSEIVAGLYKIPYDLAVSFHLFSLFALILFLIFGSLSRMKGEWKICLDQRILLLLLTIFLWTSISSLAYIGSNGRYTYSITILIAVIYTFGASRTRTVQEKND